MQEIRTLVSTAALILAATPSTLAQIREHSILLPADGAAGDQFGSSVSVDGTTAVVGAPFAANAAAGSGSVYVFERTNLSFGAAVELLPADGAADDNYGFSVALSGDTLVAGAPGVDEKASNAGAAYVFVRSGTGWSQQAKLVPAAGAADDAFGFSVAISGDTILVGSPQADRAATDSGTAYVFVRSGTAWSQQTELTATDGASLDLYGVRVAVSGDLAVVGAPQDDDQGNNSGSAYVFSRAGTAWSLETKATAPSGDAGERFGTDVDCFGPQRTVAIGAPRDSEKAADAGAVHLIGEVGGVWTNQGKLFGRGKTGDRFGVSVALAGGLTVYAGAHLDDFLAPNAGLAFRFRAGGPSWRAFGSSGAASGDHLGWVVDFDTCWGVVGAPHADPAGVDSGSAYVHVLTEPPVNYCTAGVSASGCRATVSVTGVASASVPTGFTIRATDVEGGKSGIFYFGLNGRQTVPWATNSFQCVAPPVRRTGGRLGGTGTPGLCDGVLSVDVNSFWASKPLQNPGPGTLIDAQFWYRSPNTTNPFAATLSDAIEFEVCP